LSANASREVRQRLIVGIFESAGLDAKRIPLSGSVSGFEGDVRLTLNGAELTGECKSRGASFNRLYQWLAGNDFLAIRKDRYDSLLVMSARLLARFLTQTPRQAIEKSRG
jgi:hypothetical protein